MGHLLDVQGMAALDFGIQLGIHSTTVLLQLLAFLLKSFDDALAFDPNCLIVDPLKLSPVWTHRWTAITRPPRNRLLLHDS